MATTFVIACPECAKQVKVSDEHVGKKIQCKGCGEIYPGAGAGAPRRRPARPRPPPTRRRRGRKATQAAPPRAVPPPKTAPNRRSKMTTRTSIRPGRDQRHICRAARSAPRRWSRSRRAICLECGYNTRKRQRPEVKQIYAPTGGEIFLWLLPGILTVLTMIGMVVWYLFFWDLIEVAGGQLVRGRKGPAATYIAAASPGFFRLYHALLIVFMWVPLIRFSLQAALHQLPAAGEEDQGRPVLTAVPSSKFQVPKT